MKIITAVRILKMNFSIPYNFWLSRTHKTPQVMDFHQTIEYITEYKVSVSRFSDGELGLIAQNHSPGFQKLDKKMSTKLKQGLRNTSTPNLLVCIPYVFDKKNLSFRTKISKKWWEKYLLRNRSTWYKNIDFNYTYGAANFTRYYMASENKDDEVMQEYFSAIKNIWKNRKILIVEGQLTRMGIGNDLLNNAKDVKRILGPKTDAFESYDEILNSIVRFLKDNTDYLTILALGPTASLLAQDICKAGFQAIDMGHIDTEYEWFNRKYKEKGSVPDKYVNESEDGHIESITNLDTEYETQILFKIGE